MNTLTQTHSSIAKVPLVNSTRVMVIAVECGAHWQFPAQRETNVDLVLLVQMAGESPLVFARRFLKKVVHLVEQGAQIISGALAVAAAFDVERLEARCVIARAVLRAFHGDSSSKLHLVGPSSPTSECRSHLAAIAEGLREEARTNAVIEVTPANVRFEA